jgi:hypothetical protein
VKRDTRNFGVRGLEPWGVAVGALAVLLCCRESKEGVRSEPEPVKDTPAPTEKTRQPSSFDDDTAGVAVDASPKAPQVVTSPEQQTYPAIASPIDPTCSRPSVLAATAPKSVGKDYPWTWARQALLANQQFRVVPGTPGVPGQVSFELHQLPASSGNAFALVAQCQDGGTCNHLAAMFRAVVPGNRASVSCGPLPSGLAARTRVRGGVLAELSDPKSNLPGRKDVVGQCARLQACTVASDTSRSGSEDLGLRCQRAPSRFPIACARKYPCVEVLSCMAN